MKTTVHKMTTQDGISLTGTLLEPEGPAKAIVQINPGTATKTSFYAPFAEFLNENGYAVFLWNYRGQSESREGSLKKVPYRFADVGLFDIPAVTAHLKKLYPELPLFCVGHSVGGQQVGMSPNNHLIDGLIAIATSVGYLPWMPLSYRVQAYWFFWMFAPISIFMNGYVAAKRFNIMEDLPTNVLKEWRDWCGQPDYFFSEEFHGKSIPRGNFDDLKFPIAVFSATDDPISNKTSVPRFWSHVKSQKEIRFHWYEPKEIGRSSIGHFGYFRSENKNTIWMDVLKAMDRF